MCISNITLPYSFFNVSTFYNNKTFSLIFPTGALTTTFAFTLPDGFYTINDINSYIQQQCIINRAYLIDSSGDYVYFVKMMYNATYYAVQFLYYLVPSSIGTYTRPSSGLYAIDSSAYGLPTTAKTPQLVLASTGSIKTIMGFEAGTYPSSPATASNNVLSTLTPIGSNVNSILMQCSLISNRCANPTDIIDSMPINDVSFGSNITYQPSFERFVTVSDGTFNTFTFSFRDQNLNEIYAKDPNVSIKLIIRPKKK
jgi:hypothetical protein